MPRTPCSQPFITWWTFPDIVQKKSCHHTNSFATRFWPIFRCASISWCQAVSGSVIYRFQLAHLQVFQIIWDIPHNVCLIDLCLMVEPDHQHHPVTVRAHQLVHNLEQWFTQIQKLWLSNSSKLTVPLTNVSSQPPGIGSGPPDSGLKVFFRQSFIWDVSSHLLSA